MKIALLPALEELAKRTALVMEKRENSLFQYDLERLYGSWEELFT